MVNELQHTGTVESANKSDLLTKCTLNQLKRSHPEGQNTAALFDQRGKAHMTHVKL